MQSCSGRSLGVRGSPLASRYSGDATAEALDAFLRDRPAAAFDADPGQAAVPSKDGEGALGEDVALPLQRRGRQAGPAAV